MTVEQIHIPALTFGSIIEGVYNYTWYKVRILRKNRAGIEIEWMAGPLIGRTDFKSNDALTDTNQFIRWKT